MNSTVTCPHCQVKIKVKPELAGRTVLCPKCKGQFQIPSAEPPVVAVAVDEPPLVQPTAPVINTGPRRSLSAKPHSQINPVLVIGLSVLAAILFVPCCCTGLILIGGGQAGSGGSGGEGASVRGASPSEIEGAVIGRTKDEVISVLGRPNNVTRYPGQGGVPPRELWDYNRFATDPATGRNTDAQVIFEGDTVDRVNWYGH